MAEPGVLIVSATKAEIEPLLSRMENVCQASSFLFCGNLCNVPVDLLITGIGAIATAFRLTKQLCCGHSYRLAVSAGIAGSFTEEIRPGEVVQITGDCLADLGIDDRGVLRTLAEAGLGEESGFLENPAPLPTKHRRVNGITVQTSSGSSERIKQLTEKFRPQVETMENAVFFYVCRMLQIPFVSFRAISNMVEPRNKARWNIPEAIRALNEHLYDLFDRDNVLRM